MKDDKRVEKAVCPLCGATYTEHPALSRVDNETLICPACGIRQALASIGVTGPEAEAILETIRKHAAI